jgi:hypothetical protein
MKNKKIIFLLVIFLFGCFFSVKNVEAVTCTCFAMGGDSKFRFVGDIFFTTDTEEKCKQSCQEKGATYYRIDDKGKPILIEYSVDKPVPVLPKSVHVYEPMEEIPGFGRPTDFPSYIMAVYQFGIWAIGISALLMITIGGYVYLTSAGNTSQTGKAKGIIFDAIAGIILAMVSYLLLYVINPDLVKFRFLTGEKESSRKNFALLEKDNLKNKKITYYVSQK